MASLDRNLRRDLENAVKKARRIAEAGARQSLEQLAVHHHEPWGSLSPDQRKLRNRLRAHGRQLGDKRDEKKGTQGIERLVSECAYEHWHRLLFARFLAENELLVEPDSGMPLSLDECRELAREQNVDWLGLASDFAQRMLPQIFRASDPVLEVALPPETRQELETILEDQPAEVFEADDSLGWVYQFWQAEPKQAANKSDDKIGSETLSAVTQLFTEDYMVLYLLHNTLGAWWSARVLRSDPQSARNASSEEELRQICSLPGCDWAYLRFFNDGERWRPAAGEFAEWPARAQDITVLDPCMGSGHFLAFALPLLAAMVSAEEGLSQHDSVDLVLRKCLFGLELDPRCTQIAAFNLAMVAWRATGYRPLPRLRLACSGLAAGTSEKDWRALANGDSRLETGMKRLFDLFAQAPTLGSLIDPKRLHGDLLASDFSELAPLLDKATKREALDESSLEVAIAASGLAQAAEILVEQFTLVVTNVPYLGRGKQDAVLKNYSDRFYKDGKADLATSFVLRCMEYCSPGGCAALVTPQSWLFLGAYKELRRKLLRNVTWNLVSRLGPAAFQDMNWWRATTLLVALSTLRPPSAAQFANVDASTTRIPSEKGDLLRRNDVRLQHQALQLDNPDARIVDGELADLPLLSTFCDSYKGLSTGDISRYIQLFWERPAIEEGWVAFQGGCNSNTEFGGRSQVLLWEDGNGAMAESPSSYVKGTKAWENKGVSVNQMNLCATLYTGEMFDENAAAVVPKDPRTLPAVWAFLKSPEFRDVVRELDDGSKVTNKTLVKVPFDLPFWKDAAAREYPSGLPSPRSSDPTQWIFCGNPCDAEQALQVAVARLLGYRWPRQRGTSIPDCEPLASDGLDHHADDDGIVCLTSLHGEAPADTRVRSLLAEALGGRWSPGRLLGFLKDVDCENGTLEGWIADRFFEQHCAVFGQRPFVWHIWDGLTHGFGALVNYHRLAAPGGEGKRTLEKLIYTYLGDWIDRQRADQSTGVEGADARVAAAEHLKCELEKILLGEPPYDIFVRWKPLHKQAIGWEPDLNDGVRNNIRPFMTAKPLNARAKNSSILRAAPRLTWKKDRGKEPSREKEEFPWFWGWDGQTEDFMGGSEFDGNRWNDLHYTRAAKLAARERAKAGGKS